MPNIFAECLLSALCFTAVFMVFYLPHRPRTPARRILVIGIMILWYPFNRILFFASDGNFTAGVVCNTLLFLTLAFICEAEPSGGSSGKVSSTADDSGKLGDRRPIISALYCDGMVLLSDYTVFCYMYAFSGSIPPHFSVSSYFWKMAGGVFFLLWAYCYYRIARNVTAKAPVSLSLLTILTPPVGLAIVVASTKLTRSLPGYEANIFLYGGLFGTLIAVLSMFIFHLCAKLSIANESIFARNLAQTPPSVTPTAQGLSATFIEKYEITPREREVVEAMLQGKADKEIAVTLNIAVNTVQVHLKRIYRKTGTSGRFALSTLVRGV
jgi:DNA-binding CsgD family transcriptional regulator